MPYGFYPPAQLHQAIGPHGKYTRYFWVMLSQKWMVLGGRVEECPRVGRQVGGWGNRRGGIGGVGEGGG